MREFGWTWEYIDEEMTLPRLDAISRSWLDTPPLSVSAWALARAWGVGGDRAPRKKPAQTKNQKREALQELAAMLGVTQGMPRWLTEAETTST